MAVCIPLIPRQGSTPTDKERPLEEFLKRYLFGHLAGAMMDIMLNKLRGIDKWPSTIATVSGTEIVGDGGRSGRTMNVYFSYETGSSLETGKFFVDDNSSLYGLDVGDQFSVQFDAKRPSNYYCAEAESLSRTIRRGVLIVGVAFAVIIFVIEFLGNLKP